MLRHFFLGVLSLVCAIMLFLTISCGPGRAELDPRDAEGLEEYLNQCDRRSASVTLVVDNQSTFRVKVYILTGSGSRWPLQPTIGSHQMGVRIPLNRQLLDSHGYIMLELRGGGLISIPPRPIPLTGLSCDVGTLMISPSPSMSMYAGTEF